MNYYNPYFYSVPASMMNAPKVGLISRLLGGRNLSFSSILTGTQKTLGVVNQAIPLVKQVHPMVKNAKTMFKVMNEFKKSDKKNTPTIKKIHQSNNNPNKNDSPNNNYYNQGPTFFI